VVVHEPGALTPEAAAGLKDMGHTLAARPSIGEANCIAVDATGLAIGVADPRGAGLSLQVSGRRASDEQAQTRAVR
jgi:gamma-glutamyltranspeptidase